ncbi:hypothetical protein MRX96_001548 [Rhipicephalus microplus]
MKSFVWMVAVIVAVSAHRDFLVMPWTGSQLTNALESGHVCKTIGSDAPRQRQPSSDVGPVARRRVVELDRVRSGTRGMVTNPWLSSKGGNVTASVKSAEASLRVRKDSDGHFHIVALDLGHVKIKKLVFRNSTIRWNGKNTHTRDPLFRDPVRHALSDLAHSIISGPLLDRLKKAFDEAKKEP